jgi:hypothetical protein
VAEFTIPMMVRVNKNVHQKIQDYAEKEERSVANMVRVLLNEALNARSKAEALAKIGHYEIEPGPMPEGFTPPK